MTNVIFLDALASPGSIFWAYIGAYLGHISGVSWVYLGHILGMFDKYLGAILGIFWGYLGHIFGIFRHVSDIVRAYHWHFFGLIWAHHHHRQCHQIYHIINHMTVINQLPARASPLLFITEATSMHQVAVKT